VPWTDPRPRAIVSRFAQEENEPMKPTIPVGALALAAVLVAMPATADPGATRIMSGLDNPRGLTFAPNGALFVAESGHGGAPCAPGAGLSCYGPTGAVTRYWHGEQVRVATGLPSIAFTLGAQARGPNEVAMHGSGRAVVTIGLEDVAAHRDSLHRDGLGWLVNVPGSALMAPASHLRTDEWSFDQDIAAWWQGAPVAKESDPFSILAVENGYVMTDASANALLKVDANGDLSTLAFFPSRPDRTPINTDSVPTTVTVGPDGAYYVSEFLGFNPPPPVGNANIYRVVPGEGAEIYCTGFNRVIDIAFDGSGTLYVLEYATAANATGPGVLWEIPPPDPDAVDRCAGRHRVDTGVVLDQPTSIAIGPDGALYVTNHGSRPPAAGGYPGEVWRIER
jgi:hypothetical protein